MVITSDKIHNMRDLLKAFIIIGLFYLVLELCGITCPIKFLTGVSCAGCGMSRAFLALISGHIREAFEFHPLFFLVPIWLIAYLLRNRMPKKVFYVLSVSFGVLFLAVYIYRMFDPADTIVVFRPEEAFPVRVLTHIYTRRK